MTEFKRYTKEEIDSFCEDNFIEDGDWIFDFVEGSLAHVSMETDPATNEEVLIVRVTGVDFGEEKKVAP